MTTATLAPLGPHDDDEGRYPLDTAWLLAHAERRTQIAAALTVGARVIVRERATLHGEEFLGDCRIVDFGPSGDVTGTVRELGWVPLIDVDGLTQYVDAECLTIVGVES